MSRRLAAALLGSLAYASAGPAAGDPLPVRDQNPLIRGAYLPLPAPTAAGEGWSYAVGLQWSNTVNIVHTAQEQLLVDEETAELDLTAERTLGPWRLRATLPVISRGAGVLDGFIDDWHRWLGLPRGDRPQRPEYSYAIEYLGSGHQLNAPSGSALGDLALEAGRLLAASERGELRGWLGLEAPSGSRAHLTSDGALDAAGWLAGELLIGSRYELSARAGLSRLAGSTPLPLVRALRFGTLAFGWRVTPRLEAIAQFDGHSAAVRDSGLLFLGRAVTFTLGGRYRLNSGSVFEAGVVEDAEVNHSPDVTFHFGWRWPPVR